MWQNDFIYTVEKKCPICESLIQITKVKSKIALIKQDSDLCMHYKDINPYYYSVFVCSNCSYAAPESRFFAVNAKEIEKIKNFVTQYRMLISLSGERSFEQAVDSIKLAIFLEESLGLSKVSLANLYLLLAWLYRECKDRVQELYALEKALEKYEDVLYKSQYDSGNMDKITVEYLVAELSRRVSRLDVASKIYGKLLYDRDFKKNNKLYNYALDSVQALKALNKKQEEVK